MVKKLCILILALLSSNDSDAQYLKKNALSFNVFNMNYSSSLLNNPENSNSIQSWGISSKFFGRMSNQFSFSADIQLGQLQNLGNNQDIHASSTISSLNAMLVHKWNNDIWLPIKPTILQPYLQLGYRLDYIPIYDNKLVFGLNIGAGLNINIAKSWGVNLDCVLHQRLSNDFRTSFVPQLGIITKLPIKVKKDEVISL